jgi:hypothetical protein
MPRKKKLTIEILPATPADLAPQSPKIKLEAMIERVIRERVDEVMAKQQSAVPPDFQPKEMSLETRRQWTVWERRRWTAYYEQWGCRRCDTKERIHACNGYCERCRQLLQARLARLKWEYAKEHHENVAEQVEQIVSRVESAERLLGKGGPRE